MRYTITERASGLVSYATAKGQCNVSHDDDKDTINAIAEDAIDYAETETQSLFGERSVTVIYFDGEPLKLPVGPATEITSVKDASAADLAYEWQTFGTTDLIRLSNHNPIYPITVVYEAGQPLPGAIRRCVLAQIADNYDNRTGEDIKPAAWIARTYSAFRLQSPIQ